MAAHQIIYTSCRRGIEGTSDGFQVFSYDEKLPSIPAAGSSQGYNALFVDPVPRDLGFSIFGYHPLDGDYCLYCNNTRLPHDYMGPQGRSGNMLRQSFLVPWADMSFAPIELMGSSVLRSQMGPEVQSAEKPDYLPCVDLAPAGNVTFDEVCEWLEDEDMADSMGELLAKLFAAKMGGKQLVVVATAEEAAQIIGAISYALPLRLSRQISFVLGADDATEASGDIINASAEAIAAAPDYVTSGWIVFDPHNPDSNGSYAGVDGYLGFVELSYSLNPKRLADFCSFVQEHTTAKFMLGALDDAHDLWALLGKSEPDADAGRLLRALSFAEASSDEATNAQLTNQLVDSLDTLADMGLGVLIPVLSYLLRRVSGMDAERREGVCAVAAATVSRLLSDASVTPRDFPKQMSSLCESCSRAGLDLLAILQRGGDSSWLFAPGEVSDVQKIIDLLDLFSKSAAARKCTLEEAGPDGELGRFAAGALQAAFALDRVKLSTAVIAYVNGFTHSLDVYESAVEAAVAAVCAVAPKEIDGIWGVIAARAPYAKVGELPRGLVWLSDHGREQDMGTMFSFGLGHVEGVEAASDLYKICCREGFPTHKALAIGYTDATSLYVAYLLSCRSEKATSILRELVDSLAKAAPSNKLVCCPPMVKTMGTASHGLTDGIDPLNPSKEDLRTLRALYGYSRAANAAVLGRQGMLALSLAELGRASQASADFRAYQGIPDILKSYRGAVDFSDVEGRDRDRICDAFVQGVLGCCKDLGDFAFAMAAMSATCWLPAFEACAQLALKYSRGRQGSFDRLALVLSYLAVYGVNREDMHAAMGKVLPKVKLENHGALKHECARYCGPRALEALGITAPADVAQQIDAILADNVKKGGLPFFRK